jgi:hypothetical protein
MSLKYYHGNLKIPEAEFIFFISNSETQENLKRYSTICGIKPYLNGIIDWS